MTRQVETVRALLAAQGTELGMTARPDVRGALVFTNAEFGLFSTPFAVDGVWVGWGRAIRTRLGEEATGSLPVDGIAKRLARELRAG